MMRRRLSLWLAMLALLASFSVCAQSKKKEAPEPPPPPVKPGTLDPLDCVVADFRAIGIDNQDAEQRRSKAIAWLNKHGKSCTAEQLIVMRNNRQQWMGTADNAAIMPTAANVHARCFSTRCITRSQSGMPSAMASVIGRATCGTLSARPR